MKNKNTRPSKPDSQSYNFQHSARLDVPPDIIWSIISQPENWHDIIYGASIKQEPQSERPLECGCRYACTIKGRLPYSLLFWITIVDVQPKASLHMAISGDLDGSGTVSISHENLCSNLHFDMAVTPRKGWMKLLTPVAKKIFINNHNFVVNKSLNALEEVIALQTG